MDERPEQLWDATQVAKHFGVHRQTALRWIYSGRIEPAPMRGQFGKRLFYPSDVLALRSRVLR